MSTDSSNEPGIRIVRAPDGWWDVRTATHALGRRLNWHPRTTKLDNVGTFASRREAKNYLAVALQPPANEDGEHQ